MARHDAVSAVRTTRRIGSTVEKKRRVHVVLMWPHRYVNIGIPWAAAATAEAFRGTALDPVFYLPQRGEPLPQGLRIASAFPPWLPGRVGDAAWAQAIAFRRIERRLLKAVKREGPGALVWLWPGTPLPMIRRLRAAGALLVREMINTARPTARRILDEESSRLGLPPQHDIDANRLAEEREELSLVDLIVSPSETVDASLIAAGVEERRIIRSTFGWDPAQFVGEAPAALPGPAPHALFVGSIGIRKGVHLALDAWSQAATGGTLVIVGRVDPELQPLIDGALRNGGVEWIAFTRELGSLYKSADFMLFPTLEEGAPLVCYQAAGCGLPILTSAMGAGRLIENEVSGLIVDPHDQAALVTAIRRMVGDSELRRRLGVEAKRRADGMTWANAAADRARQFAGKLLDAPFSATGA